MFVNASEFGDTAQSRAQGNCAIYRSNEGNPLLRLAYLITGDEVQAEDSVIAAYELAEQGKTPFRELLLEWAKCATVRSAIEARLAEIRRCENRYKHVDRKRPGHRPQVMTHDLPVMTDSIFRLEPEMVVSELDPLARAILVLRGVLRASVRDCSIQLNVSSELVLAVQRRITTWLTNMRKNQLTVLQRPA